MDDLTKDVTQDITARLEPLMCRARAALGMGASPHKIQANHLVAGVTHTLSDVRSQPTPTPAAAPQSVFVPRTAQLPFNHVQISTWKELDGLVLPADVEPYGTSDVGR